MKIMDRECTKCGSIHRGKDHDPADLKPCGGFDIGKFFTRIREIHRAYWLKKGDHRNGFNRQGNRPNGRYDREEIEPQNPKNGKS